MEISSPVIAPLALTAGAVLGVGLTTSLHAQERASLNRTVTTVEVTEGTDLLAALSADGERAAFVILGQPWVVERGDPRARPLGDTLEPTQYFGLAWAPDSRRLAGWYWEGDPSRRGVRIFDTATGRSVAYPEPGDLLGLEWAPDGEAVLYGTRQADSTVLWRLETADGSIRRLATLPAVARDVSFSPDLEHVAYDVAAGDSKGLWEVRRSDGARHRIVADSLAPSRPAYSQDGTRIAFLAEIEGARAPWVMSRASGVLAAFGEDLEDVRDGHLTWAPSGDSVAVAAAGQIHLVPVAGGPGSIIEFSARHQVGRVSGLPRPGFAEPGEPKLAKGIVTPDLSPRGDRIAFAALGDIWIVDTAAGSSPRRLTRTAAEDARPEWSPDGRRIAHFAFGPRATVVWVRSLDGGAGDRQIVIPHGLNFELDLAWHPDGNRLAYAGSDIHSLSEMVIGVIDLEAFEAIPLVRRRGAGGALVGWSQDGREVVFTERIFDRDAHWYRHRFARVDPVAIEVEIAEVRDTLGSGSAWTPDLDRVAYAVAGRGSWQDLKRPDMGGPVPDPVPESFSWSSDGRLLLYQSGSRLRLLDVATGAVRSLAVELPYHVPPAPPPLLIHGIRVVDGTGSPRTPPLDVLVAEGRISAMGAAGTLDGRDARRLDGTGLTLLPGLINLHVHLGQLGPPLIGYAYFGTTTVRDVGASAYWMRQKAERIEAGEAVGPRVLYSGGLLQEEMGYDWEDLQSVARSDTGSVRNRIAALIDMGASVLKIRIADPPLERLAAALAHEAGLPVTSHYVYPTTMAGGLEGKEHTEAYYREAPTAPYRQDLLGLLEAGGTCVTTTLMSGGHAPWLAGRHDPDYRFPKATLEQIEPFVRGSALEPLKRPIPGGFAAQLKDRMATDQANVLAMVRHGVLLGAGTDAAALDLRLDLELRLLVQAGLTPLQAIRTATADAARCAGMDQEVGTVEENKRADLLLVRGDPSEDIEALGRVEWVLLGGRLHPRDELVPGEESSVAPSDPDRGDFVDSRQPSIGPPEK